VLIGRVSIELRAGLKHISDEARASSEKVKKLKALFKGLKFFLNREVPREPVVFTIRCFGGINCYLLEPLLMNLRRVKHIKLWTDQA
jgi:hypothetical protein